MYPPLSTTCQEDTHRGLQLANGSATSPFLTGVWASVLDSYWAQSTGPLEDTLDKYEAGSMISSDDQSATDYDFYVDSPTSIVSLASQPISSQEVCSVFDSSSHNSTESVPNMDLGHYRIANILNQNP